MSDFRDGFEYLQGTKDLMMAALQEQGQEVTEATPFRAYASMILNIEGGTEPVYVHFAYSIAQPSSDEEMLTAWTEECAWLGVYAGSTALAPTAYAAYHWMRFRGADGDSFHILGMFGTLPELQAARPTGSPGDLYLVGTAEDNRAYVWSQDAGQWMDAGRLQGVEGPQGVMGPAGPNQINGTTASTLSGILKGSGGNVVQAMEGIDYAAPARSLGMSLVAEDWVDGLQTLTGEWIAAQSTGSVRIAQEATAEEYQALVAAMPQVVAQESGALTVRVNGDVPEIDIPIVVVIL